MNMWPYLSIDYLYHYHLSPLLLLLRGFGLLNQRAQLAIDLASTCVFHPC